MAVVGVFKAIDSRKVSITPFKTYKNWKFNQDNYNSNGITVLRGIHSDIKIAISASSAKNEPTNNDDGSLQKVIYYSIDNLYYRRKDDFGSTFGIFDKTKALFESASVVSIPQQISGENIKEKSILITDKSISGSIVTEIKDDGKGVLYDTKIITQNFVSSSDVTGYWGFNEKFYSGNKLISDGIVNDNHVLGNHGSFKNIRFSPGIKTTGHLVQNSGRQADFLGTGYIQIKNYDEINFKFDRDFSISMFINLPSSQSDTGSGDFNYIISKEGEGIKTVFDIDSNINLIITSSFTDVSFPYSIRVYNQNTANAEITSSGKLWVGRNDGSTESFITSSIFITGSQHHILFQKTGSTLELWIDATLDATGSDLSQLNTHNSSDLFLGTKGINDQKLSGSIDEVRICDRAFSSKIISSLASNDYLTGSAYNINKVGNVHYEHGILVFSSLFPKHQDIIMGRTGIQDYSGSTHGFDLDFKGTHTIYEHEFICQIESSEFNQTFNPTVRKYDDDRGYYFENFVTQSAFTPYITTIGLYDEFGQLLVIGKLASPIPKRNDVPMNFIVRFDT